MNDDSVFETLDDTEDDTPGPWFLAGFDGECSRGYHGIDVGDTIRADGEGEWECQHCVDTGYCK